MDPARARAYRAAIRAARAAHHDGHDDEAARQYQAALAISGDGRALCELGWIHFQAGRHDEARAAMTRALTMLPSSSPVPERFVGPVGACFYNLGRLEEDEGHVDAARAAYQRSLAVRPGNAVVTTRLASLAPPTTTASPSGAHECASHGAPLPDLDAWIARATAIHGTPDRFDAVFAELSLTPIDPEQLVDGTSSPLDPVPSLHVSAEATPLRLPGGASGRLVHVSAEHEDNTFDRLVALRAVEGGYCVLGTFELDVDACSTSCLSDDPRFAFSTMELVAEDVDTVAVETSVGACACGSERGSESRTHLLGVEGDHFVEYVSLLRYDAWYDSPTPPIEETAASIDFDDAFPHAVTVETSVTCVEGCSTREVAERRRAIAAETDEDAASELEVTLEEECGYYIDDCDPSTSTARYVYRAGRYVPASP